jgi:hypothetical protein
LFGFGLGAVVLRLLDALRTRLDAVSVRNLRAACIGIGDLPRGGVPSLFSLSCWI